MWDLQTLSLISYTLLIAAKDGSTFAQVCH